MSDIADLRFSVDSSELGDASDALDEIPPAAGRAEGSASRLTSIFSGLGRVTSGLAGIFRAIGPQIIGVLAGMLAAFSVDNIIGGLVDIAQKIDDISKAATKLGANMGDLQALGLAADLAGQDFNALAASATKMNRVLATAVATGKGTEGVFKILGVSAQQLIAMPITERFSFLADKLGELNLTAEQSALVLAKLGDRSGSLFALLDGGSEGIKQASALLEEFNGKLTPEQGLQVEAMNDAWTALTYSISAAGNQIVAFLAPFLSPLFMGIAHVIGAITTAIGWLVTSTSTGATVVRVALLAMLAVFAPITAAVITLNMILKAVFGVSLFGVIKSATNFMINAWRGAFAAVGIIWDAFPAIIASAAIGAVNMALKEIDRLIQASVGALNSLASAVSKFTGGVGGDLVDASKLKIGKIDDPWAGQTKAALDGAKAAFTANLAVDNFADTNDKSASAVKKNSNAVVDLDGALNGASKAAGGAAEKLTELQRIGKQLDDIGAPFDQAKSAFEKLGELQANGIITGDQYTQMLGRIQAAFIATGGTASQWAKITVGKTNEMMSAFKDFATNALTQVGDSFIELAMTGKTSFSDLARSVISDLLKMMWQMLVVKPLINSLFGGTGLLGGLLGGAAPAAAAGVPAMGAPAAVSDAAMSSLGKQRTSAANQNGGNVYQMEPHIHMTSTGDKQKDEENINRASETMRQQMEDMVDDRIARSVQHGGVLNRRGM